LPQVTPPSRAPATSPERQSRIIGGFSRRRVRDPERHRRSQPHPAGRRIGFLFVPITLVVFVGIPQAQSKMASGIINFMRNVDGGVANLVRRHTECDLQRLGTGIPLSSEK